MLKKISFLSISSFLGLIAIYYNFKYLSLSLEETDLQVYKLGAYLANENKDLYNIVIQKAGIWTYTPFAAVFFKFLLIGNLKYWGILWNSLQICSLLVILYLLIKAIRPNISNVKLFLLILFTIPITLLSSFTLENLTFMQINVFNLLLIIFEIFYFKKFKGRGAILGLIAGIKTLPILFLIFFILEKDFKSIRNFFITYLSTFLIGYLYLPHDTIIYFKEKIFINTYRQIGEQIYMNSNHSYWLFIDYLLHKKINNSFFLLATIAVLAGVVFLIHKLLRSNEKYLAFALLSTFQVTFSPVSWNHHAVFLIPAILYILLNVNNSVKYPFLLLLQLISIFPGNNFSLLYWYLPSVVNITYFAIISYFALLKIKKV